ncbi:DUF3368 domain-containing protein [Microcoleus sp. FACHB-1515]|uniref:DUF3368 domain-containing protein n=1 Tax=Cyanophyceae TaxID=3028117 RepID=UPI001685CB6C|nr:DUF3368 domain-containing protein [Microcoleus sp. FACHB-1515]MBD2092915.1 DUF3368 domain-containing protein [Microcoleus sp. FACHB-1515]
MLVVSDTSPLCYLLLINQINLLPRLYDRVIIPQTVRDELTNDRSPHLIKQWIETPPDWLEIQTVTVEPDAVLEELDPGERQAILLVEQLNADLLLVDERQAREVARSRNIKVVGVLGILEAAANLEIADFPQAIALLQETTFRASPMLIQSLLEKFK